MMTNPTADTNLTTESAATPIPRVNSKMNIYRPQNESPPTKDEKFLSSEESSALAKLYFQTEEDFNLSTDTLKFIRDSFVKAMEKGLEVDDSDLPMIPTFVTGRPTGEEVGSYFAIDLGGSNLRICLVHLKGPGQDVEVIQRKYLVPEDLKVAEARLLFDYIADHIENFLLEYGNQAREYETISLGFTFSFPVIQTAINKGKLLMWNKGFNNPGALGKDVVQLLQDALDRKLLNINVSAIVNDTVGTLLSSAYKKPNTLAGVILGTGTNAAYYEKLSNIKKWKGDPEISDEMILNIEWGNFDTQKKVIPCTIFDHRLDRETQNPYTMVFEKMISGRYLGEIVRHILLHLIDNRVLFGGKSTEVLNTSYQFLTSYLSEISDDHTPRLTKTRHILEDIIGLAHESTTQVERETVRGICEFVARRSARLSASVLAALCVKRSDLLTESVTVGVDGSLFEHHPKYVEFMKEALVELMGETDAAKIHLAIARDGSGIGAAMTAMIASQ